MTRIPLLSREAILPFFIVLILANVMIACTYEGERETPPPLVLFPGEARPGSELGVLMTAEGIRFDKCVKISNDSFSFASKSTGSSSTDNPLAVKSIGYLDNIDTTPETLRVYLAVAKEAELGKYTVKLQCDTHTALRGTFEIKELSSELALELKPPTERAGVQRKPIKFQLDPPASFSFFDENLTQITFGDGDAVRVVEQQVVHPRHLISALVSISPSAPKGEMDVTVVTGSNVARGKFVIGDKITPNLKVDPREIFRPLPGGELPRNYTLTIEDSEQFLTFEQAPEDAGTPEDTEDEEDTWDEMREGTRVSFPLGENGTAPGLEIHTVKVLETSKLTANVTVREYAPLGSTRIRVQTGSQVAETAITVLPSEGAASLRFNRGTLVRGVKNQQLIATAVNFEFHSSTSIQCLEPGCLVESPQTLTSIPSVKQIILRVSVAPDYDGKFVRIEVNSEDNVVRESLTIIEPTDPIVSAQDGVPLMQGMTNRNVTLSIANTTFDPDSRVITLPRSGMRVVSTQRSESATELSCRLDIAKDAPVGPALLRIETGGQVLEVAVEITPSLQLPSISISPRWIPEGRSTGHLRITSRELEFDKHTTAFQFDDPAIEILEVAFDESDARQARLHIAISPQARSDMIVLYVHTPPHVAAGTLRVIQKADMQVLSPEPNSIGRGEKAKITVRSAGFQFRETVGRAPDNAGITINNIVVNSEDNAVVSMDIETEATGPGGWIGLILTSQYQSFVIPLQIMSSGDESLTMKLTPESLTSGSRHRNLEAQVSSVMELTDLSEIQSGIPGAYFSWPIVKSARKAQVTADISFDIDSSSTPVPVILSTTGGAAIGYLRIEDLDWKNVGADLPFNDVLSPDAELPLIVDPSPSPAVITTSTGQQNLAKARLGLVSENGLDVTNDSMGETGNLWLLDDKDRRVTLHTIGEATGSSTSVSIKPLGARIHDIDNGPQGIIVENPCIHPVLLKGFIENAFDVGRVSFEDIPCRIKVQILARDLSPYPFDTPDLRLERWDMSDSALDDSPAVNGVNGSLDPFLYLDKNDVGKVVAIGSRAATSGHYLMNVRRPDLIRQIGTLDGDSFIVLEVDTEFPTHELYLDLHDAETGLLIDTLSLPEISRGEDGIVVIGSVSGGEVDVVDDLAILPMEYSFALSLRREDNVVDAVQIGGEPGQMGEGKPIFLNPDDPEPICSRVGGIDTNDNAFDFVCGWTGGTDFET